MLVVAASIPCTAISIFILYAGISSIGTYRLSVYRINHKPTNRLGIFRNFVLPSLMPSLFQAIRLIVPYSLVLAVALEMMQVGQQDSAGRLLVSRQSISVGLDKNSFEIIILLGLVSFILSKLLERIETFIDERSFR